MGHPKVTHNGVTFTWNEKCHCYQFNLPPRVSCPGVCQRLKNPKNVCNYCYAYHGRSQQTGAARRVLFTNWLVVQDSPTESLFWTLSGALGKLPKLHQRYFRWMGCGDIPNLDTGRLLCRLAGEFPHIHFWCPTQNSAVAAWLDYPRMIPQNLSIRFTQPLLGKPASENGLTTLLPEQKELPGHYICPGKCGTCRMCWNQLGKVAFRFHGSATLMARFKKARREHGF